MPPSPSDTREQTLILASASPRRAKLLRDAGFEFEVVAPPLDDASLDPGRTRPRAWAASLAYLKAHAVRRLLKEQGRHGRHVLLAADTIVLKETGMIGQPRDEADARRILRALRDGSHIVLTGVAILHPDERRDIFTDEATVRVGHIPDAAMETYLRSGDWRGKAGAYNLDERIAAGWPISFEGDPCTVMGLPMRMLTPRLRAALGSAMSGSGAGAGAGAGAEADA